MADGSTVMFKHNKSSVMWKHFYFERKEKQWICKYCGKSFVYYGGTSNLCSHLKNMHLSVWPTTKTGEEEDKTPAGTKSIEFFYATDIKS